MKLYTRKLNGRYREATRDEVRDAAREAFTLERGHALRCPTDTADHFMAHFAGQEHETFAVLYLDNRHKVIACENMFRGTIDGTAVYPREVVKAALAHNAAAIILAHNHPSGICEPSQADERITHRLKAACELVDIRILDHIICGDSDWVSLASRGMC